MLVSKLNEPYRANGNVIPRMETEAFNLMDPKDIERFTAKSEIEATMVKVPFSDQEVWYDPSKRVGIGITKLGTSSAVAVGAYAFAMEQLKK